MILTGRLVSASEGLAFGFVNEVASAEGLLDAARRWATEICASSPLAVRASKQTVMRSLHKPVETALREQSDLPALQAMRASDDAREGPRAFAEKRPPRWTGR